MSSKSFEVSLVLELDSEIGLGSSLTETISETLLGVDSDDLGLLEVLDELLEIGFKAAGFNSTSSTAGGVNDLLVEVFDRDFRSDFFGMPVEVLGSDFAEIISSSGFSSFSDLEDSLLELDNVLMSLISFEVSLVPELDSD